MSRVRSSSLLRRCLSSRPYHYFSGDSATCRGGSSLAVGARVDTATTPLLLHLQPTSYRPRQDSGAAAGFATTVHSRGRFSTSSFPRAADGGAGFPHEEAETEEGGVGGAGEEDEFEDPRDAILDAALDHVEEHGFSATALAAGAKDCGFHSVAAGMFPKGEADLVHHLMAQALKEVKRLGETTGDGDKSSPGSESEWSPSETERLRDGIKAALSCLAPYKAHWPHAMSVGLLPQNAGATATAVAVLADELAFLSGDRSTDLAWYGKRGLIGGVYASTELFMLTDESEGLSDTWAFLDRLLSDYEILASSPENAADVATGVSTVAASLGSAAFSLAGPFLKQASKQVPGAETLAQTAPNLGALASQALSFVASQAPHAGQQPPSSVSGPAHSASSSYRAGGERADITASAGETPPTFPGAPERDPWSEKPGSASGKPSKFEEELAQEERELFGGRNTTTTVAAK